MRRLLNVAYAALAENRDTDDLAKFDAELEAEPGKRAVPKTTGNLAAVMAAARLPQRGARR